MKKEKLEFVENTCQNYRVCPICGGTDTEELHCINNQFTLTCYECDSDSGVYKVKIKVEDVSVDE